MLAMPRPSGAETRMAVGGGGWLAGRHGLHRIPRLRELPTPEYPAALRGRASEVWWRRADLTFGYAPQHPARHGRLTQCVGLVAQATAQAAHAVLAARGEWITNEKNLLTRAGLGRVDEFSLDALHSNGQVEDTPR